MKKQSLSILFGILLSVFLSFECSAQGLPPSCSEMLTKVNQALNASQTTELQYHAVVSCRDQEILTFSQSGHNWQPKLYRAALLERRDVCSGTPQECFFRSFQIPRLLYDGASVPHNSPNINDLNFQNLHPDRYQIGFGLWGDNIPAQHVSSSLPTGVSPGTLWGTTYGSLRESFQNDPRIGGQFREEFYRPLNTGADRGFDISDPSLFPHASSQGVYFEGRTDGTGGCYGSGTPTHPGWCLYGARMSQTHQTLVLFDLPEAPTPTPTSGPYISPSPTPTLLFSPTPTATPDELCLSEEEVKSKTDELLFADRDGCAEGVIEDISNKIFDINKKACIKPRPKPDLRHGLFRMINHEQKQYSQWPACHEQILRAILAGGYSLVGNPSQRRSTKEFLEDNNWDCSLRIKDQIHPYRLGNKSQHRNVLIAVPQDPKKANSHEYIMGVTEANKTLPENYPLSLRSLGYERTAIELYEDLSNERSIPTIGMITQKKYSEILKKIPRDKVGMYSYGVFEIENRIQPYHTSVKLNDSVNRALTCFPPKERVVKEEDSCDDYAIDDECFDSAKRSAGLVDAGKIVKRNKKSGRLKLAQLKSLSSPDEIKLFMRKAFAALDEAGWPQKRNVATKACTFIGVESSFSPSTHYCGEPSSQNILQWQQSGNPFECPRGSSESSRGWFQVNGNAHNVDRKRMHYAVDNARYALKLWKKRPNWGDWINSRNKIERALSGAQDKNSERIRRIYHQCVQEFRAYESRNKSLG